MWQLTVIQVCFVNILVSIAKTHRSLLLIFVGLEQENHIGKKIFFLCMLQALHYCLMAFHSFNWFLLCISTENRVIVLEKLVLSNKKSYVTHHIALFDLASRKLRVKCNDHSYNCESGWPPLSTLSLQFSCFIVEAVFSNSKLLPSFWKQADLLLGLMQWKE